MAWSMLGMSYDLKNKRQMGDYCFKHSIKAGGKHSQFVKEWHFIGPFGIAKYYSELVPGAVSWVTLNKNEADEMVHARPKIDWNDLVSSLGSLGITEWQGWAVGEIFINEDNTLLNYRCLGHAAAVEPIGICSDKVCPVFLTLHGTTVPPQNQADSYKKMVKGDYEFGVSKMWLLAPIRHGAPQLGRSRSYDSHDSSSGLYETWTHRIPAGLKCHQIRQKFFLQVGSKRRIWDSNLFFRHDISTSNIDPAVKAIMEACIAENDADRFVANLKALVFSRIGANDRTVHPYYT
ncbi:hypothetical protein Btru_058446 [Bulinus truncatus]|nr:hypothetical protein Btru_058446 [Bulinus truncatus]